MKNKLKLLSVLIVMICGCESQNRVSEVKHTQDDKRQHAAKALQETIKAKGSLVFGSRLGQMKGQDSDTTIELKDGGKVVVMEYILAETGYYGFYSIDPNGIITVSLKNYPNKWPDMFTTLEKTSFLLHREDGITASSKEAQQYAEFANVWPFALLRNEH